MKSHQSAVGKNDEWLTPPEILKELGTFDLDPCASKIRPWSTAKLHYTENGLDLDWIGRIWCNPPFNRYQRPQWMKKISEHGNGVLLIPAATETKAFYDYVWNKANAVLFLRGRPHFYYVDGSRAKANCGTAICLVAYGKNNVEILEKSDLGKVIKL